ncbi:MAG: family peptidase [Adhaeribacter sp.]|nr:family peptidase [Adhaeribacter sp.]
MDGTFAEYSHIQKGGSTVKKGDTVEKGQLIAKSGNVGYTTGPHLHFAVFLQRLNGRESLKTKFAINNGEEPDYLVENKEYTRRYK